MNDRFTLSGRISRSGENLLVWLTGSRKDIENAVTFHFFALVLMDSTLLRHLSAALAPGSVTWTCAIVTDLEEVVGDDRNRVLTKVAAILGQYEVSPPKKGLLS
jgi:hypothetical protein